MISRTIRFLAVAAVLAALAGCQKPGPEAPGRLASEPAAAAGPLAFVTKSGVEMIYLPGGAFTMGSRQGNPDEAPPHPVKLSPFLMDKFEVTQELFRKVELPNPSRWHDQPRKPIERVRWRDAKQYCNERSRLEGLTPCYNEKTLDWDCDYSATGYRLPTEAEWEYACRAGTDGHPGSPDKLRPCAWFAENADQKTHPVGQKKPNPWGLHDLLGNVSEWCEDVYDPTYYQRSPAGDPAGPPNSGKDVKRVIRGGSWKSGAGLCRPTARQGEKTGDSDACFSTDYCGFRCVRRATLAELNPK
jgi:formylglycine-generating enzyme required for sulfatase activity